jgi:hypothetical protein
LENKGFESEADSPKFLRRLCTEFADRELRACYPADIISIVEAISAFEEVPVVISKANLKRAADIYFTQTLTLPNGSE